MQIGILGSLEVRSDDGAVVTPAGATERQLLAVLLLDAGTVVSADRLIDALWGDEPPGNPTNALQARVSRLRKSVGSDAVLTRAPGYLLDIPQDRVDARRFETLVAEARVTAEPEVRRQILGHALDLWRGEALVDFAYDSFARIEADRLEELRLGAIEARVDADLEVGRHGELVAELEALVGKHPLREGFRQRLMLSLYRSDRQAEALRAYQETRRILGEELGIDPSPALRDLEEKILMQDETLTAPRRTGLGRVRRRLAASLKTMIGRDQERSDLLQLMVASRLVTVVGPGGVGKTTLATMIGVASRDRDVVLVDLGSVTQPELVPATFAAALSVDRLGGFGGNDAAEEPATVVAALLAEATTLLLVDNCEHLVDETAQLLERLLLGSPDLAVLATSREPLGVPGEIIYRLNPLGVAGEGDEPSDAVSLFVDRARSVEPSFNADEVRPVIVEICRRLDGMPLAIELAAARVRSLSVAEIAIRLDDRFRLLTGGGRTVVERQRTLRAAIDWSYRLLSPEEQLAFQRLSLLAGSFSLETAEELASGTGIEHADVLDLVERLVDQSMIIHEQHPAGRYRILETLRAFGRDRLASSGEGVDQTRRTIDHFAALVTAADAHLRTHDQIEWLDRLDRDYENTAAALELAWEVDAETAVAMTGRLGWYWYLRGMNREAAAHLARATVAAPTRRGLADVLFAASVIELIGPGSPHRLDELLEVSRTAGYARGEAGALALIASVSTDIEVQRDSIDQARSIFADLDDAWGLGLCDFLMAAAANTADHHIILEYAESARKHFSRVGDRWGMGISQFVMGTVNRSLGHYDKAMVIYEHIFGLVRDLRFDQEGGTLLAEMANISTLQGDLETAESLLAEAEASYGHRERSLGAILNARGMLARRAGKPAEAIADHRRAVELFGKLLGTPGMAYSAASLARAATANSQPGVAAEAAARGLESAVEAADVLAVAFAFESLAGMETTDNPKRSAVLLGAAHRIRSDKHLPLPQGEDFEVVAYTAAAVASLGRATYDRAFAEGQTLDLEAAVTLATSGSD